LVGVGIRSWSSILEVTVTLVATFSGNTDGAATVSNTPCEALDVTSLVLASKTLNVVLSVDRNVLLVAALELLDSGLDVLHTSLLAHLLAGEVAVKTSSVPITWSGLGVERNLGTELFRDAVEEKSSQPEMITH
jgi:hypothetical protein